MSVSGKDVRSYSSDTAFFSFFFQAQILFNVSPKPWTYYNYKQGLANDRINYLKYL